MSTPRLRPVLELELSDPPDQVMAELRARLADCPRCVGVSVGRHAELFVPERERRVWSPWLSVTAEADGDRGARIRGRFAPHPHVWTLYMFLAFGLVFGMLVGATWAYAQWAMGQTPWALLSVPLGALLAGGLYLVSLAGQRLAAAQIQQLADELAHLLLENPQSTFEGPPTPPRRPAAP
jgi:hypothetical protein